MSIEKKLVQLKDSDSDLAKVAVCGHINKGEGRD